MIIYRTDYNEMSSMGKVETKWCEKHSLISGERLVRVLRLKLPQLLINRVEVGKEKRYPLISESELNYEHINKIT